MSDGKRENKHEVKESKVRGTSEDGSWDNGGGIVEGCSRIAALIPARQSNIHSANDSAQCAGNERSSISASFTYFQSSGQENRHNEPVAPASFDSERRIMLHSLCTNYADTT